MARPNKEFVSIDLSSKTRGRLLKIFSYIKPYKWPFVLGMVSLILSSASFMLFPAAAGEMANAAIGKSKFHFTIQEYGLFFLVLLIIQGILAYIRSYSFAIVSEKSIGKMRTDLFSKIICLPVSFYESNRVGELTSRITGDIEQVQNVVSVTLAEFLRQVITLILGVAFLFYLTPKLSLIMLITFPIIVILAILFGRHIRALSKKRQEEIALSNAIVEEAFQLYNVVKAFANETFESKKYQKNINKIIDTSLSQAKVRGFFFLFVITVLFGGIFFILYQGAILVQRGQMEIGDLFSFIIYTGIIGGAIASLGTFYSAIAGALGATDRMMDIMEMDDEFEHEPNTISSLDIDGSFEVKDVSFSYPSRPDIKVLNHISFDIKKGSKVALVGQSGAGKSTIVQLLLRFHRPDSGQIKVDGIDADTINLYDYRKNFAIVPQDIILFGGSILENIRYGNPEASEAQVIEAARQSNSLEFIESFPEGLNTIVGDRGIRLSGGQKQRIAIARAILKDPKILILDEATSSLDSRSEGLVQDALNKLMKGRTSVIIAHRLSTIMDADEILVIKNGQIIERGNHRKLMDADDSWYRILSKIQEQAV